MKAPSAREKEGLGWQKVRSWWQTISAKDMLVHIIGWPIASGHGRVFSDGTCHICYDIGPLMLGAVSIETSIYVQRSRQGAGLRGSREPRVGPLGQSHLTFGPSMYLPERHRGACKHKPSGRVPGFHKKRSNSDGLFHVVRLSRRSHCMRSADLAFGLEDLVKSERLTILVKTPV